MSSEHTLLACNGGLSENGAVGFDEHGFSRFSHYFSVDSFVRLEKLLTRSLSPILIVSIIFIVITAFLRYNDSKFRVKTWKTLKKKKKNSTFRLTRLGVRNVPAAIL